MTKAVTLAERLVAAGITPRHLVRAGWHTGQYGLIYDVTVIVTYGGVSIISKRASVSFYEGEQVSLNYLQRAEDKVWKEITDDLLGSGT